eukprot:Selendium_serpulae@DN5137_c0_g1_i1.p1
MSQRSGSFAAVAIGVAAGAVCGVVYYIYNRKESHARSRRGKRDRELALDGSDEDLQSGEDAEAEINRICDTLRGMRADQAETKKGLQIIHKEIQEHGYDFQQTYDRVAELTDTLTFGTFDKNGLNMQAFDTLLAKHDHHPDVRELLVQVLGNKPEEDLADWISYETLIKVHELMLEELEKLVNHFTNLPNKDEYAKKSVVIAAQALVGAKLEQRMGLTPAQVEAGVCEHQKALSKDKRFQTINIKITKLMSDLLGAPFAQYCT